MQKYFFINPQLYNAKKNFKMYNKSNCNSKMFDRSKRGPDFINATTLYIC